MTEKDAQPGDIIESPNGNRYLILEGRKQAYLGNQDPSRSDENMLVPSRPTSDMEMKLVGRAEFFAARAAPQQQPPILDQPFHDHGAWAGPCSAERHDVVRAGGPADKKDAPGRTAEERARFTLTWTRLSEDGLRCLCCRELLLEDSKHEDLDKIVRTLEAAQCPMVVVRKWGMRLITRLGELQGAS